MVQDCISDQVALQGQGWKQSHLWIFCEGTAQMPAVFTNQHWPANKVMTSYILSITLFFLKIKVLMKLYQFSYLEKQQKTPVYRLMRFLNVSYLMPSCKSLSDEHRYSTNRILDRDIQRSLAGSQKFMSLAPFCTMSIFV